MKRTLILTVFLILGSVCSLTAQQMQTLITDDVSHGGFGAPAIKVSNVAGEPGLWVGGRGGWIINIDEQNAISLGGGGYGLVTNHSVPEPDFGDPSTDYYALNGYGGFELEYTNRPHRLVHLTLSSLIGGGGLMIRDADYDEQFDDPDPYFVFEPGANIELNVTDFMRVAAGVGYRYTSGISRAGFEDSDFSGVTGTLTFKFGKF